MRQLFNNRFRQPWRNEMDAKLYAEGGDYAFSRLPWVLHDDRMTIDMRFSKKPTSPEFDAIAWEEGRAKAGDSSSAGEVPFPILIAYVDFDNDGRIDTVMKQGFMTHYQYRAGSQNPRGPEQLLVWRGVRKEFSSMPSLWSLMNEASESDKPVLISGLHLRLFLYSGQTYVARYSQDWGDSAATVEPPLFPQSESMSILKYDSEAKIQEGGVLTSWIGTVYCEFQMKAAN